MGILDQMATAYGPDWNVSTPTKADRHNWETVCVCGHLERHHSPTVGGAYRFPEIGDGQIYDFDGCVGAMPTRGFEAITQEFNREARTVTHHYHPTCPCTRFRPVARVDRPNRYFTQRVFDRHPMTLGLQAFFKFLTKRKAAETDPDWATAELDRRFTWIPEAQRCSISSCKATGDDVLPAYVNGDRHSDMRCSKHR